MDGSDMVTTHFLVSDRHSKRGSGFEIIGKFWGDLYAANKKTIDITMTFLIK